MTGVYAVLHMLVDGICALAMFGSFVNTGQGAFNFLLYNFCAFALQMPLGVLLDFVNLWNKEKKKEYSFSFVAVGIGFTLLGSITHPVILGIGNALFHVGGGVGTIGEDEARGWKGRGLGVFVAPGALGLYIGTVLAKQGYWKVGFLVGSILTLFILFVAWRLYIRTGNILVHTKQLELTYTKRSCIVIGCSCCLVVILRSYLGMVVAFPWKQVPALGLISVLAVVCGKMAGGFLAAKFGYAKTTVITLLVAAIGYWGMEQVAFGLVALFAFNMTMPMTLYLLIKAMSRFPGFAFGVLTFGLFLGFLPIYFGVEISVNGQWLGSIGSILSMGILLIGIRQGGKHETVSD